MVSQKVPLSWCLYSSVPFTDDFYASLDRAAEGGAKNIVLHNGIISYLTRNMSDAPKLVREVEKRGLVLTDAHAPFGQSENLGYPVERDRKWIHELQKNSLRVSGMLGLKTLTMHIGRLCFHPDIPESTPESVRKYTLEILDELLPVAEENKVVIALENLFHPTATCDELPAYIEHYGNPEYLGICFDTGHANVVEAESTKTPEQMDEMIKLAWPDGIITYRTDCIEKMLPYIVTTHLHDNNGRGDHHQLPGVNGNINWERICNALAQAPRLVTHQSEVKGDTFNTVAEGIAHFAKYGFFV